jgi:hypothetical protein
MEDALERGRSSTEDTPDEARGGQRRQNVQGMGQRQACANVKQKISPDKQGVSPDQHKTEAFPTTGRSPRQRESETERQAALELQAEHVSSCRPRYDPQYPPIGYRSTMPGPTSPAIGRSSVS